MEVNNFISKKRFIAFIVFLLFITSILMIKYIKQMLIVKAEVSPIVHTQERGTILDRNGKILAAATTLYNVSINKSLISDVVHFAEVLAPIIDMPANEIIDKITSTSSHFLYLKKKLSESEKELIQEAITVQGIKGMRFEAVSNRTYPENILASTLIGYLGDDGRGLAGIEYSMQRILSPPQGTAPVGYTVFLTIDSSIQYMLQQIAEKAMRDTQAEAIILLAADARTGELLAYVNEPSADLAHFADSTEEQRFDRPAYFMYEPGSVFKIFSMASFLDMHIAKDTDEYTCKAKFVFTPQVQSAKKQNTLRCLRAHGRVTPRDIIRFSCNDGMAQIADKAEPAAFAEKLKAFGFGSKTGIELPGEASGLFAPAVSWSARSKHTIAIGQEIAVTSLQIMQAATAFTNGGKTLKLSLLSEVHDPTGICVYKHKRKIAQEQVISPETARLVLDYMRTAADEGTGEKASINGVPIAVKTGTAQMAGKTGKGYSQTDYLSSCIGIFPVDEPKIIVYTAIIRPVGETYGSIIAAPIISAAANAIIDYHGMERTNAPNITHSGRIQRHGSAPVEIHTVMPNVIGIPKRLLLNLLTRKDIVVQLSGDGYVVSQTPPAGTPITKGMRIELTLN